MKTHPKILEERRRLQLHLEHQKQLIREDLVELKADIQPLGIVKKAVGSMVEELKINPRNTVVKLLSDGVLKHPVARIVAPILIKTLPDAMRYVTNGKSVSKKSTWLGGLKNAVSGLRKRVSPKP